MSKRKYFFTSSKKSPTNDDDDDHLRESKYPRIKIDDSTIDTMDVEDVDYSSSYLVPLSPSPSPSPSPSCHSPSYSTYCITNHDDNSVSNELKKMNLNNVEMGFNVCNTTLDITDKMLTVVGGASSVAKNFSEFAPLISSFLNVGNEIIKLYKKAKQHKELCGFLLKRCKFAMAAVEDLDLRKTENVEFFSKQENLTLFLGFINCMEGIKSFIAEVSQLKTLQKYLYTNSIEEKFTNLATEFDGYMQNLNFSFTIQSRDELLTVKNEIQQIKEILLSYGVPDDRKSQQNFFDVTNLVTEKNIEFQEQSRKRMVIDSSKLEENEPLLDGNEFSKTSISPSKRIEKRTSYKNSDDVCFKEFSNNSSATLTKQEETQIEIRRQVNILKLLKDSEHIIRFYGVAHDDNKYYLVTEWMKHGNLHEYYTKCKDSINLETKIKFALDICRGVAYLHECEILHRDIQSANILVNGHNKVKIANFGLSRKFSDITRNILQNLENIRYMAPEKLLITNNGDTKKRKISYDSKCEIYSVGALLWEIAELKKPHSDLESEPIINIRERVKKRYCLPFTNSVPPEWEHVVTKAMEYDPKWRINISEICREFYKMSEKYSGASTNILDDEILTYIENEKKSTKNNRNSPITITILSVDDAINEHKKGNKQLAWQSFSYHSETDIEAKYWLGYYYYHEEIPELQRISKEERIRIAIDIFKETADKGNPSAQLRYGMCLWKGEGVAINSIEAFKYLKMAANQGNPAAMYIIGKAYWNGGDGIEKDKRQGAEYLKKAASNNHPKAKEMCIKNCISYNN
ncbi:unnamed protein product [Rhizophagus irregularis]|nr:unnamed protein product [Rhizophagus irregularis]